MLIFAGIKWLSTIFQPYISFRVNTPKHRLQNLSFNRNERKFFANNPQSYTFANPLLHGWRQLAFSWLSCKHYRNRLSEPTNLEKWIFNHAPLCVWVDPFSRPSSPLPVLILASCKTTSDSTRPRGITYVLCASRVGEFRNQMEGENNTECTEGGKLE